jgi:Tfp pilus assembly protein FimT
LAAASELDGGPNYSLASARDQARTEAVDCRTATANSSSSGNWAAASRSPPPDGVPVASADPALLVGDKFPIATRLEVKDGVVVESRTEH